MIDTFINFLFSPIVWLAIGWYSGRSALQHGSKAGCISALKVLLVATVFILSLIGLLSLTTPPT